MISPQRIFLAALALSTIAGAVWYAMSATPAVAARKALSSSDRVRSAQVSIPDKLLLNQDGEEVRLFSDLIKGKQVVINFVFTTCNSVCPTLQTVFEGAQDLLGDRLGSEVNLISISVDPGNDTPARLKAFAEEYHAREGWTFLTGDTEDINEVLRAFGVYARTKEEHSSMFVLGHEPTGRWMYTSGFVNPGAVLEQLETLCAAK